MSEIPSLRYGHKSRTSCIPHAHLCSINCGQCLLDHDLFSPLVLLANKATLKTDDCKSLPAPSQHGKRPCPPGWIGYQGKCFFFSDEERNWTAAQDFCSLYNASLAIIEKEDLVRGENILLYCGWYQFHVGSTYISSACREFILQQYDGFILCWSVTLMKTEKRCELIFIKEDHLLLSDLRPVSLAHIYYR